MFVAGQPNGHVVAIVPVSSERENAVLHWDALRNIMRDLVETVAGRYDPTWLVLFLLLCLAAAASFGYRRHNRRSADA